MDCIFEERFYSLAFILFFPDYESNYLLLLTTIVIITGCADEPVNKKMIVASESWQESRIICQIVKQMMAKNGVEVEIKRNDLKTIFNLLEDKKVDVFPDVWDNMHDVYTYDKSGFEDISSWYDGARLGIVAPTYVTQDSLWKFAKASSLFGNQFYTLEATAGVSIASKSVFKTYNMNPIISEMSETELMEHIDLMKKRSNLFYLQVGNRIGCIQNMN